jgi:glycosyltransferase involved in cell wall biosynthesis
MPSGQIDSALASLESRDVVLLATADWDHPFWTNKQHVALTLAELGHRVLYVESVGLRAPRLEGQDVLRIWRRLCRGLRPPRRVAPRLWVWSPLLIPAAHAGWRRRLNQMLFSRGLWLWRSWLGLRADLFWTYNPLTSLLLSLPLKDYRQSVYHCVDDLAAQPCMPSALITAEEEKLCRLSDQIFVTSPELLRTRSVYNSSIRYHSNVADVSHFAAARSQVGIIPEDLAQLPRGPRLGFIGAISRYKLDLDLLAALAAHRPDCQIVLIGRVGEGDPSTALEPVMHCANVHHLGPKPYAQLPDYLRGFDVALLPCPLNDYTRSMFPMKFFEYLAAGVPVVATDLPALYEYKDLAHLCVTSRDFLVAIDELLIRGDRRESCSSVVSLDQLPDCCSYHARTRSMLVELQARLSPADWS